MRHFLFLLLTLLPIHETCSQCKSSKSILDYMDFSEPQFDLSSPLFDKVVIHIDSRYHGEKPCVIKAVNNSPQNVYIQSATLNGIPLQKPKIKFKDVVDGGTLILKMGPKPNTHWGV